MFKFEYILKIHNKYIMIKYKIEVANNILVQASCNYEDTNIYRLTSNSFLCKYLI